MTVLVSVSTDPCTSALMIRLIVLMSDAFIVSISVSSVTLFPDARSLARVARQPLFGDRAGPIHIIQGEEFIPRHRQIAQTADDHRRARPRLGDALPAIIHQAPDAAIPGAR